MKREMAVIGMVACVALGLLGGWFIPSPIPGAQRVSLLDEIKTRGYFIVGTSADYPPFENVSYPSGEIVGFDINLSRWIATEIGVGLQMLNIPFGSLIAACRAGTIDMIAAAMTYTEERADLQTGLAPSITYINVSQAVITRNDSLDFPAPIANLTDLIGFDVGAQRGTVMETELKAIGFVEGVDLWLHERADDLILDLWTGGIDAAYVDEPIFTAWVQVYALKIIFTTGTEPFALWTRHREPELMYEINKVIFESYLNGRIFDLMNYWFGNITA